MTKQIVIDQSLPSVDNNTIDEKQSIWASILCDVKASTKKAPEAKAIVILGDNESGRTTLVAKLQDSDDPKQGAGLEYHYIDIRDDDRDDTPKLGVWILDGNVACSSPLLKFPIKNDTLENIIVILVASMAQPWSLLSTLNKWINLVDEHIDRLKLDSRKLQNLRDRLQYDFQHYVEPNDSSIMMTSTSSSMTIKNAISSGHIPNSASSISIASTVTSTNLNNGEDQIVLPLADGVLTKSLGIPVIVVITKCDFMSTLEKENNYKDEQFDFIQYHLRKFCLEYGAALFYTSVRDRNNIDKLYKYIIHKCYGYSFTSHPDVIQRDSIFIPSGWDNPKKIDILLENLQQIRPTDNYSDVFVKPILRRPLQRDNEIITAEDDQEFLSRLQSTLNRTTSPGKNANDETTTRTHGRTTMMSGVSSGISSHTLPMSSRSRNQQNASPSHVTATANESALAAFFSDLLKKPGKQTTPTTTNAPPTQRQNADNDGMNSTATIRQNPEPQKEQQ